MGRESRNRKDGLLCEIPFYSRLVIITLLKLCLIAGKCYWQLSLLHRHPYGLSCRSVMMQSSQVDLLAKSEICNGVDVVFDAAGVTPLGGFGGMLPQEILKNGSS